MGPFKITEFKPLPLDTILVLTDRGWRLGYWECKDLFVLYSCEDEERNSCQGTWWAPLPPQPVEWA